jgi:hypothetical protein
LVENGLCVVVVAIVSIFLFSYFCHSYHPLFCIDFNVATTIIMFTHKQKEKNKENRELMSSTSNTLTLVIKSKDKKVDHNYFKRKTFIIFHIQVKSIFPWSPPTSLENTHTRNDLHSSSIPYIP